MEIEKMESKHSKIPNKKYIDTTFKNRRLQQVILVFNTLQKIKQEDTDLFINEATGENSYQPKKGERKYFSKIIPCLGPRGWQLLLDIVWAAGEWVELDSMNHVNVLVFRLRKIFGDDGNEQWFFETRKNPTYAIRWNPKRSWRFIEKKAQARE